MLWMKNCCKVKNRGNGIYENVDRKSTFFCYYRYWMLSAHADNICMKNVCECTPAIASIVFQI